MKDDKVVIVILDDDYMEAYRPFPNGIENLDDYVKRKMLERAGVSKEIIDRIVGDLELDYKEGADGMFDDGPMTPIRLIKIIKREPSIPPEPPIGIPDPPELSEEDEAQKPRQIMLKQYYGDRKAETTRRKVFSRFKSHIVQKTIKVYDKDGSSRDVQVYTVEDYPERKNDSDELLLDGYSTRLERLSRAHQKDFVPYEIEYNKAIADSMEEIMIRYEEMHETHPLESEEFKKEALEALREFSSEEFKKKFIQALIDRDTEFIETNNYGYNSHQNTQENLRTLGKFGEKSVRAQVSDEQSRIAKLGLHTMNMFIEIRNHTSVPIHQAIGTFVAAPIHRLITSTKRVKSQPINVEGYLITPMEDMIETSQKHSVGMFKNKPSHRYQSRKDYFIEEVSREEQERLRSSEKGYTDKSVKRVTPRVLFRLAITPRLKAVFNYREGNIAVLNAGLHDIEVATEERKTKLAQKRLELMSLQKRIISRDEEIKTLQNILEVVKDPKTKEAIQKTIDLRKTEIAKLEGRLLERSRLEIDSIQTDALSMSQHDKANKSNMTKVVKGVKMAARVTAGVYISKYIYRQVANQAKTPDTYQYVPGTTTYVDKTVDKVVQVPETVIETRLEPGLDKAGIGDITLDSIYDKGSGQLYHHVHNSRGGRVIADSTDYFRGIAFRFDGDPLSGSDGYGFDPTKLTTVKLSNEIGGNTTLVDVVQDVIQSGTGKSFTREEIEQFILEGRISNIDLWRSSSEQGIPTGWFDATDIVPDIISSGTHEVPVEVTKMVEKVIQETIREAVTTPGYMKVIPGKTYTFYTSELNPVVVAAEAGLGAMEIADWNELLRFTRSQKSVRIRQPQILEAMQKENAEQKENTELHDGKKQESTTSRGVKVKEETIKSFQRNNKSKKRRYVMKESSKMHLETLHLSRERKGVTVFEQFIGTRRGDFNSGYDENAIGTNARDNTPDHMDISR